MPIKRQSLLPCSKSDLVFAQPSDRPAGRLLCVAEEIAHLIFEFSIWREAHGAHDGWADEMLLAGEGACMCYVVDGPVELDGGIDVAIQEQAGLPSIFKAGGLAGATTDIAREEHIERMQAVNAENIVQFLLNDGAEGE